MLSKRIIALCSTLVILFSTVVSVRADYTNDLVQASYWERLLVGAVQGSGGTNFGGAIQGLAGTVCDDVCQSSDDALHHTDSLEGCALGVDFAVGRYALATCCFCGDEFKVYSNDLQVRGEGFSQEIKDEYGTSEFGSGILTYSRLFYAVDGPYFQGTLSDSYDAPFDGLTNGVVQGYNYSTASSGYLDIYSLCESFSVATTCDVTLEILSTGSFSGFTSVSSPNYTVALYEDNFFDEGNLFPGATKTVTLYSGKEYVFRSYVINVRPVAGNCTLPFPSIRVSGLPLIQLSETSLEETSRPTSITGNYGIIGDDGTLTKIDTQTIVNEGSSTYYNPITNTSYDLSGWTYDYSTRTYNLTTADDNSVTVTYGDENVTINEGDTTYNVYYLVESPSTDDGSGSGDPGTGEDHTHDYTSEITTAASCLLPGVRTYTCSCGDTYTKSVPATGHAWAISQQVNTTYDPDTGELLQQGYTVYVCNTCGEQYKDEAGTGPPNGSTGDSSEETVWDKLGNLLGTVVEGFLGLLDGLLGGLLDGMISLLETALGKLTRVVEIITSMFQEIPALFGGFLDLLGAVFPFIPEDMMTVLTFGLVAIVAVGLWKAFRR